jgi:hypothetical protein
MGNSVKVHDPMKIRTSLLLLTTALLIPSLISPCSFSDSLLAGTKDQLYANAFARLASIKNLKKDKLIHYCNTITQKAKASVSDSILLDFFLIKNRYYLLLKETPPPANAANAIETYKKQIVRHFSQHYMQFYDILFINATGDVFFTIRREDEYHDNIFADNPSRYPFASALQQFSNEKYVDFQFYDPSKEPAAFFVEPVYHDNEFEGWIVLQWAVDKLNHLFSDYDRLGKTGEIFLVNREQFLLTDIRFVSDSTILTKHLSKENIERKFQEKQGNIVITDYRGFQALSSFEVFSFMDSEWLIITKIDKAEILNEEFRRHKNQIIDTLLRTMAWDKSAAPSMPTFSNIKKVDMDEYLKASVGECLETRGVSTCTVVIAGYPARFAYMAHISPYDEIYGEDASDLVGSLVKRIKGYDIYNYELPNIQFYIVANHLASINAIITKLLEEGLMLSQIHFLYNPEAQVADVLFDVTNNQTCVTWMKNHDRQVSGIQTASRKTNLGTAFHALLQ